MIRGEVPCRGCYAGLFSGCEKGTGNCRKVWSTEERSFILYQWHKQLLLPGKLMSLLNYELKYKKSQMNTLEPYSAVAPSQNSRSWKEAWFNYFPKEENCQHCRVCCDPATPGCVMASRESTTESLAGCFNHGLNFCKLPCKLLKFTFIPLVLHCVSSVWGEQEWHLL